MESPGPALLLSYRRAAQHLLSKAGVRVLQVRRSASSCPLARLAGLVLPGRRRLEPRPQNCRRVVVLGAPRAGKTSILRRFLREDFQEKYEPTREDFHRQLFNINGENFQLDLLDPAGEREFPAKRRLTILTGDVFLLVLSVDDRRSFEEVLSLRGEISQAKAALFHSAAAGTRVPVVVCANKSDLRAEDRVVSREELLRAFGGGQDGACTLFETSAKEGGAGLERAFEALAVRAGLPLETGPSRHRRVSLCTYRRLSAASRRAQTHETPCGVIHPLARRPSVSTDLRLVLQTHRKKRSSKSNKK